MKMFMLAGEASGDALGGPLMQELKAQGATIEGIGGASMQAQGLKSLMPMEDLAVMGLVEVLGQLPRLIKLINKVVREVEARQPDIYLGIDLPDFNFRVGKLLKKRGIYKGKILHYVGPTVWAWRPGRAQKIAEFLDGLLCLFPFEPAYFTPHGLRAEYVGHPIIEADGNIVKALDLGIPKGAKTLGLFFGSRAGELKRHGEILKRTAMQVQKRVNDLYVIAPTVSSLEGNVRALLGDIGIPHTVIVPAEGQKWPVFKACDAAVAVSGTVGLELAYMNVPHVIGYKMNALSWAIARRVLKTKYAHLGNIITDEAIIPEYIQNDFTPENVAERLIVWLNNEELATAQQDKMQAITQKLKAGLENRPSKMAAEFITSFC